MRRPRSRSSPDLDAVDVLLLEDEDEDVPADEVWTVLHELALESMTWRATWPGEPERLLWSEAPVAAAPVPSLARRVARRFRRLAVAGAVLAVAVPVTTAVVDARRSAAHDAALEASPAVLAEVTGPLDEMWRVPGRVVGDQDDRLLVVDGASLRAVRPSTGQVVWTASDAAGRAAAGGGCFPVDEGRSVDRAAVADAGGPDLVACVAGAPGGSPEPGVTTAAEVVVVDTTTGRTRHTVTVDGALLLAEPVERDLLVAAVRADGGIRVTRWDLVTRTPRWDTASAGSVTTGGTAEPVERRPDSLRVGSFAVDLEDGEHLDAEQEGIKPSSYGAQTLPGGALATWSWNPDGTFALGRVSGGRATSSYVSYMLPGPPLRPPVTDGSDAGVLVARTADGDRLRGLDLRTGRMRWSRPFPGGSSLRATALVDGVLVLQDGATVTALEVGTGRSLWRAPGEPGSTGRAAVTDGQVVLLPVRADDGVLELVAHRIADGTVLWRAPAPTGTVAVTVVDRRLVASTGTEVIGLG